MRPLYALSLVPLLLLAGEPSRALPKEKEKWVRVRTGHFTLVGNARPGRIVAMSRSLERLRETLASLAPDMETESDVPTLIYVFRHDESFKPYKLGPDGKPRNVSGYFAGAAHRNYVAVDASAGDDPFSVVFHEYVHYWLESNLPGVPLWLNEGLAEYYSTARLREDVAEIGRPVDRHLLWLKNVPLVPLKRMFSVRTDSPDYNEAKRQGTFYAQSWLLAHYLLNGGEDRRAQLGRYLGLLRRGVPHADAWERVFGEDVSALEQELDAYRQRPTFMFLRVRFKEPLEVSEADVEPLAYPEVLYLLGDLLAHGPETQLADAEAHLRRSLELEPEAAEAHAALGLVLGRRGELAGAERHLKRAVALAPRDARMRWVYGAMLMERLREEDLAAAWNPASGPPPLLLQAREQFRKSLELNPENKQALVDLAKTYAFEPEAAEAVGMLARAYQAVPSRTDLLFDLIAATARSGNAAGARALLDKALRPRGRADMIVAAESVVVAMEITDAVRQFNAGEHETALNELRAIVERTTTPELVAQVRELLARMEAAAAGPSPVTQGAATRGAASGDGKEVVLARPKPSGELSTFQVHMKRYEEAVEAVNAGEYARALPLLEAVAAYEAEPALQEPAAELLRQVRRKVRENEFIRRYNEAVDAARAKRFDEAETMLEALLADEPGPGLRARIEDVLDRIRAARR